jgi:hypothetical protein
MSKPSYDNPDASKDVRTKKGSIGTFFKPAGAAPSAPNSSRGVAAGSLGKAQAAKPAHQQQHQQQHTKSPGSLKKGSISSFFKPVGSPAGKGGATNKQQQQQLVEGAGESCSSSSSSSWWKVQVSHVAAAAAAGGRCR